MMQWLLCLGLGYSARTLARGLDPAEWTVQGTRRAAGGSEGSVVCFPFDGREPSSELLDALSSATHLLVSVPPAADGDPVLRSLGDDLLAARALRWIGYLSSTGVYGDHGGATVDEASPCRPTSARAARRLAADLAWRSLHERHGLPVHVFRLAGIYGPGRSTLDRVRAGATQRIIRDGHVFNRIHVDDIARALVASMERPRPGRVYNVSDDEPAAQADVVEHACRLLSLAPGPRVSFDEASRRMSPGALSFWGDNRRVANRRLKRELVPTLRYPTYREGLRAILEEESS